VDNADTARMLDADAALLDPAGAAGTRLAEILRT